MASKIEKEETVEGCKVGAHMYHLGNLVFVNISKFKYLILVALREYYIPAKTKSLRAGKTGISLTAKQWFILTNKYGEGVTKAIEKLSKESDGPAKKKKKGDEGKTKAASTDEVTFEISDNKKAKVKMAEVDGTSQVVIDVREYSKSGDSTDKAMVLTVQQWNKALEVKTLVDDDLKENFNQTYKPDDDHDDKK